MKSEFTSRLIKIEAVLHTYIPTHANPEWKALSFGTIDSCIQDSHITPLIQPCKNLIDLGGKRWRPLLLVLCAELASQAQKKSHDECSAAIEKAYTLTPLVEFAHTASLIHDDIEDCADTRRGEVAAHIAYGLDVALNAASWLYFEAATCIKQVPASEQAALYELFLTEMRRLHLGQAMDILWHRNPRLIPSIDEYRAMVHNKTGTLSRLAVKLGLLAGGASAEQAEQAGVYAEEIGLGFQIIDDVINLTTGNPGKKRGDDIVEGKKSLPVLYHLAENNQDKNHLATLFELARTEGIDSPAVEEAISLLTSSHAIEKAAQEGTEIIQKASTSLASLFGTGDSEARTLILDLFAALQSKAQ
ncbi:MAG: polyprenyl synthetase family protein [Treponema sp.]|nr:polyprenyl synthetase family protein [Treponema sp.]